MTKAVAKAESISSTAGDKLRSKQNFHYLMFCPETRASKFASAFPLFAFLSRHLIATLSKELPFFTLSPHSQWQKEQTEQIIGAFVE